jgi:hypothetical protein
LGVRKPQVQNCRSQHQRAPQAYRNLREHTVSLGKIADVLKLRGDLDESLRIRRNEELPVYIRVGDTQGRAITLEKSPISSPVTASSMRHCEFFARR